MLQQFHHIVADTDSASAVRCLGRRQEGSSRDRFGLVNANGLVLEVDAIPTQSKGFTASDSSIEE